MTQKKNSIDQLVDTIVEGIEDLKGEEISLLNLKEIDAAVCDYFIICSGNSNTHVSAIANAVKKRVSRELQDKPWHVEGTENGQWILMDYVNVVVHVFQREAREYYDIEGLWGDAKTTAVGTN